MIKETLLDILRYLTYQVENDRCTMEEMRSIYRTIAGSMEIDATVRDVAEHYGQSESNVRNVLSRSPLPKPKRKVYHNLALMMRHIPKTWRRGITAGN